MFEMSFVVYFDWLCLPRRVECFGEGFFPHLDDVFPLAWF